MEDKKKEKYYKLLIAIAIIIPVLIGLSYAYFTKTGINNNIDVNGKASDKFEIDLITENDGYINATNMMLIKSTEIEEKSEKGFFKVQTGANDHYVNYTLSLTSLSISSNLQVSDFKWQLICLNDASKNISGTFNGINANQMTIKENILMAANTVDSYEFRIWIEETDVNQMTLLNGSFSGKFNITAAMIYNPQ